MQIEAFRGLRYDLGHVGALSDVVAPPYDVIGPELQDALYKQHPANVIRLILNREEPGDGAEHNRYERAARFLKNWQTEGVLARDPDPALYVYHQVFEYGGQSFTRRGFMGRLKLEPFGEGNVFPHEETHAAAKADRLKLTRACRANLSQIFGIYPDADNRAQERLENAITGVTPLEATDHLGVVHRLWAVTDVRVLSEVAAAVSDQPLFIADGHHRYETACNYRRHLLESGELDAPHPANFVLTMCVSMNDPGMIVLPTHRLFRGLPSLDTKDLTSRLNGCFECEPLGDAPAADVWETIQVEDQQSTIGLWNRADGQWLLARLTDHGRAAMAEQSTGQSEDWQSLGVSLLHRLIVGHLLEAPDLPKPTYVHQVEEVVEETASGQYPLAALVMPATLEHIRRISRHGERMPAKSTYFYPKLLSGLVIHSLES